jgi:hypothetical protein
VRDFRRPAAAVTFPGSIPRERKGRQWPESTRPARTTSGPRGPGYSMVSRETFEPAAGRFCPPDPTDWSAAVMSPLSGGECRRAIIGCNPEPG